MNTGHIGELLVSAKLTELGWVVHPAPGGCAVHDLVIWKQSVYRRIQVKCCTTGSIFKMASKHELIVGDDLYYVFISLEGPRYWIVPAAEVAEYCQQEHRGWLAAKEGRITNAIRKWRSDDKWLDRWDLLIE